MNTINKLFSGLFVLSTLSFSALAESQKIPVLLLAGDIDFTEPHLKEFARNKETPGYPGSLNGWSLRSNSPVLYEGFVSEYITANKEKIATAAALETMCLKTGVESYCQQIETEGLQTILANAQNGAWGTPQASVVGRFSKGAELEIQAFNGQVSMEKIDQLETKAEKLIKKQIAALGSNETIFDSKKTAELAALTYSNAHWANLPHVAPAINKFIKASGAKIVKAEYFSSNSKFQSKLKELLASELKRVGLDATSATETQKNNLTLAYKIILKKTESSWCSFMAENPKVLFVMPAGHHDSETNPNVSFPASCGVKLTNVLTSTVVDEKAAPLAWAEYSDKVFDVAGVYRYSGFLPTGIESVDGGTCTFNAALTGVAASIWSQNPSLSAEEVKKEVLELSSVRPELINKVQGGKFIGRDVLKNFDRYPELAF